jgi:GT2 family glycosyltransferase
MYFQGGRHQRTAMQKRFCPQDVRHCSGGMMAQPLPFFSIINPTFNRPDRLSECLESIALLKYPRDCFEVIVVDDGSDFSPEGIVDSVRERLDARLLRQRNRGPASARNNGAATARGAFLAFTDDDCVAAPDWLNELADCFGRSPDTIVGGRTVNALDKNPFSAFSQRVIDAAYRHYNKDPDRATFFASNNLAVPAETFRAVGGFDPDFLTSEDREFCDRLLHQSRRLSYAPGAVISHANNLTFISFCRQHFNYGRGAARYYRARAGRGTGGYTPDAGFYRNLLRCSWQRLRQEPAGLEALRQVSLLLLWLAVNTLGFGWELVAQMCLQKKTGSGSIREME